MKWTGCFFSEIFFHGFLFTLYSISFDQPFCFSPFCFLFFTYDIPNLSLVSLQTKCNTFRSLFPPGYGSLSKGDTSLGHKLIMNYTV